jgi:hypothetical protein
VRSHKPLASGVEQQARQQARLGRIAARSMTLGEELVANRIPGLGIDQRRMLAGIELTLVGDLPDVDRVGSALANAK